MKNVIFLILCFVIMPYLLMAQNIGVNTINPSAKLHVKGKVSNKTSVKDSYEEGPFNQGGNVGEEDWFITSTEGYMSSKSAKCPFILVQGTSAILQYEFSPAYQKEITISFWYKYLDDKDDPELSFSVSSNNQKGSPSISSQWNSYTLTYISTSSEDFVRIEVEALESEVNPLILIDNLVVSYQDGQALKIEDGSQGEGRILESDALGHTKWIDFRTEIQDNIDQTIAETGQTLSFNHSDVELEITEGNSVVVSGLKNANFKTLRLDGFDIIASPGLSLTLPASNANTSMFEYEGGNGSFYRGKNPDTVVKGNFSTRWGWYNKAEGSLASVWGQGNEANGYRSTAWGFLNKANGEQGTIWGANNISTGINATTFGDLNINYGSGGTVFGYNNGISNIGNNTTVWGQNNFGGNANATVWGESNESNGIGSTSWGDSNISNGQNSTAFGKGNIANTYGEVALGRFNSSPIGNYNSWDQSDQLFSVGAGSSDSDRGNAMTLWKNGKLAIGEGSYDATMSINSLNSVNTKLYIADSYDSGISISGGYRSYVDLYSPFDASININGDDDAIITMKGKDLAYISLEGGEDAFITVDGDEYASIELRGDTETRISFGLGTGNALEYDDDEDQFRIAGLYLDANTSGDVGIKESAPSYDLHLKNNDAAKPGSSAWDVSSDSRLKKDVESFTDGLELISAIDPVWFTYNGVAGIPETRHVGTIAQELQKIAPYMVGSFTHKNEDGTTTDYLDVNYGAMDFVLVNAIKEQQEIIEDLQATIENQNKLIDAQRNTAQKHAGNIESLQAQIDFILSQMDKQGDD